MDFRLKLRILFAVLLAAAAGWFFYGAVVPSGRIVYDYKAGGASYFLGRLTPTERMEREGGEETIIGDPTYLSLRTPRPFSKATITFKYQDGNNPLIEMGMLTDKKAWRYQLVPIENAWIEKLSRQWDAIREGDLLLLQRKRRFDSIGAFLASLPPPEKIATYNYVLREKFTLPGYRPGSGIEIRQPIRGAYQMLTYVKDEPLSFHFELADLNKNLDKDPVEVDLLQDGRSIKSWSQDAGIPRDDGRAEDRPALDLYLSGLPEGVYKLEFKADDDIVTKNITTRQDKLSFLDRIWLADGGNRDIRLFSDAKTITAQTANPGRLQSISVGSEKLDLKETYKQFSLKVSRPAPLVLEKDDVILSGNGAFSFDKDELLDPSLKKVDGDFDPEGVDYIIADYRPVEEGGGWKVATAEFNLKDAYREKGRYNFLFSVPGLNSSGGPGVRLGEIKVELQGKTLWAFLSNLWHKWTSI